MKSTPPTQRPAVEGWFALLLGVFLATAILKFGNPPVMESFVTRPADFAEFVIGTPWPIAWAYMGLVLLVALGLFAFRWSRSIPIPLLCLPLAWWLWQLAATPGSMSPALSADTVKHFSATVACFYLGVFCLRSDVSRFWLPLTIGFVLVIIIGFTQHFGGLDATRKYFYTYIYPTLPEVPPEYLKKITSDRIFSTLFYPNSLAGCVLLLLPPILATLASNRLFSPGARAFLTAGVGSGALACLYWSGSKAGWLLFLVLCLLVLLRSPLERQLKAGILGLILLTGLAGFFVKYAGFFRSGATSVVARFDYWQAGLLTIRAHPLLGTGPGTFGKAYNLVKRPESEPTRLAHNDYLQQGSDSGLPGFLLYSAFVAAGLYYSYPRTPSRGSAAPPGEAHRFWGRLKVIDWMPFAVWSGIFVWFLQGLLEFGLYIPGNAWPAFTLLGWALGRNCSVDKSGAV